MMRDLFNLSTLLLCLLFYSSLRQIEWLLPVSSAISDTDGVKPSLGLNLPITAEKRACVLYRPADIYVLFTATEEKERGLMADG